MKSFLLLLIIPLVLFAEDIHLKNGEIYKNIKVLTTGKYMIVFELNYKKISLDLNKIDKITADPYKPTLRGEFVSLQDEKLSINKKLFETDPCQDPQFLKLKSKDSLSIEEMKIYIEFTKLCEASKYKNEKQQVPLEVKEYRRLPMLLLTAAAVGGAVYFFGEAGDYSDAVELANVFHIPTGELSSKRDINTGLGIGCIAVAAITFIVAIKPVTVKAENDGFRIGYKLPLR